jgi:hypothetical protein
LTSKNSPPILTTAESNALSRKSNKKDRVRRVFNHCYSAYDLVLLLGDIGVAMLVTWPVFVPAYFLQPQGAALWTAGFIHGGALAALTVFAFYCSDLYAVDQAASAREMLLRLMNGFGLFCLVVGGTTALIPEWGSRTVYLGEAVLMGIGLFLWRSGSTSFLR